jgi:nucleoid DNA-binding protein
VTKQEFTGTLADRCEFSKAQAGRALDAILDVIQEALIDHDEVSLPGFGKFTAQKRRGRDATDPRNPGRTIHIAPSYAAKFKPGVALRRAVSEASPPNESASKPHAGAFRPRAEQDSTVDGDHQGTAGPATVQSGARTPGAGEPVWRPLSRR